MTRVCVIGAGVLMRRDENESSLLSEPVGRIVFAGEHTSPDWSGTIEGALRSGERTAADVVRLVGSS